MAAGHNCLGDIAGHAQRASHIATIFPGPVALLKASAPGAVGDSVVVIVDLRLRPRPPIGAESEKGLCHRNDGGRRSDTCDIPRRRDL